ncbi:MAG: STAS domain-containing protein [Bacteroidia bacterium]|nr:STAS domain-containing protein [Bacteroidia bacterium]MCZ2248316.1 STAS domain-containing protein [Bacteroidia bacterium]
MSFNITKRDKYTLIDVKVDKLDNTVSPFLKSQLVVLNAEGVRNIILNMQGTKYCDSSGLSAILVANRLCKNSNGSFVLTNIQEAIKKLISISQLDSILNITESIEQAEELLSISSPE